MVRNTSSIVMNEVNGLGGLEALEGQLYRRSRNNLEKEGVCMPGAGLVYMVTGRDLEDFDHISDFSERVADEIDILSEKMLRLELRLFLLLIAFNILAYLAILWPGVMEQHGALLTILMSKVGPTLVVLYIWRELIGGAVYAKWKTIKHDRLEIVRRVNDARRRLPVVAWITADGIMRSDVQMLNERCYSIVTCSDYRMKALPLDCVLVILIGLLNCIFLICWF